MAHQWLAAVLSLFTIAGGHFLNRRPCKAFLFLFLFLLFSNVTSILLPLVLSAEGIAYPEALRGSAWLQVIIAAAFMLASAFVSFIDAGRENGGESQAIVIASGVIASAFGALMIAIAVTTLASMHLFLP
ncbi:MAG TPA: hypothetical protein VF254_09410 [Gammaproteobacteria bacterium]